MSQPFNKLTEGQVERLACLSEELAESIQAIGKILRHGYESKDPTKENGPTNREWLEIELRDVMAAITVLVSRSELNHEKIIDVDPRLEEMQQWIHYKD